MAAKVFASRLVMVHPGQYGLAKFVGLGPFSPLEISAPRSVE